MTQRSPLVIGLLFLATTLVDLVAIFYMREHSTGEGSFRARTAYAALFTSQVSLITIWAALRSMRSSWQWVAVVLAILTAASLASIAGYNLWRNALLIFATPAVILWLMLWCLLRTSYWRRFGGSGARLPLRFSLKQLLLVMTYVALLVTVLKNSRHATELLKELTVIPCGSALLALIAVCLERTSQHRLVRLGSVFGAALFITFLSSLYQAASYASLVEWFVLLSSFFLLQAAVLELWLALCPIVLPDEVTQNDSAPTSTTPKRKRPK